jgi:anti-anti-sigma factor
LRISGELDMGAAVIGSMVHRDPSIRVIDLHGVTFINAAGLGVLCDALHRSAPDVVIRNPAPCVKRLLALVGLDGALESPRWMCDLGWWGRR